MALERPGVLSVRHLEIGELRVGHREVHGGEVEVRRLVLVDLLRQGDRPGISFPDRLDIRIGRERRLSASCSISVSFARWVIPSESAREILSTNCMTWRPNSSWTVFV